MERKVKYHLEFKLKCVKELLEDCTSVNSISSREVLIKVYYENGFLIITLKELMFNSKTQEQHVFTKF